MRYLFTTILIFPLIAFAQKKPIEFYGNANILLRKSITLTSPILGGGVTGGIKLSKFGIGLGAEAFKIFSDINTAVPVFVDVRYTSKKADASIKKNAVYFVAVNLGKLNLKDETKIGGDTDNNVTKYKGKSFYALETGVVISLGTPKYGLLLSVALRRFAFETTQIHSYSRSASGAIFPTQTTTRSGTSGHAEFAFKIGFQF